MRIRAWGAVVAITWLVALGIARAEDGSALDKGVEQVRAGAFDEALLTLDRVVRELEGKPAAVADLKRAHLWLGTAYIGLEQEEAARRHFKEALKLEPGLVLDATEFSPRTIRVFEATKKGKSKAVLYAGGGIGLGVGTIAGLAAVLGGATTTLAGGEIPFLPTTTTQPPTPPLVVTFQGTLTSTRPFYRAFTFTQRSAGTTTAAVEAAGGGVTFDLYLCNGAASSPETCSVAATTTGNTLSATMTAGNNTAIVFARVSSDTPFTLRVTHP
jgi:hypothetical protein